MKKLALLSAVAVTLAAGAIVPTVAFAQAATPPATPPATATKKPVTKAVMHAKKMPMHAKAMSAKATGPKPAIEATTDQLNQQQLDQANTK